MDLHLRRKQFCCNKQNSLKSHMKTFLFLAILFLAISNPLYSDTIEKESIKVMSFNIRYGSADDGENSWEYRKNLVFDVIKNYSLDILGLQEAEHFQIEEIMNELHDYDYYGVGRDDGKTKGEYCAILFKKNRFKLLGKETFWFSDKPNEIASKSWGNNITRICSWVKLADNISREEIYFFNLHLDHRSENSRTQSVELLLSKLESLNKDANIIITGDFNAGEKSKEIIAINKSRKYLDTYLIKNPNEKNRGTFNGFVGTDTGERIDYIFVSNNFEVITSEIDKFSKDGKYPSDHFPVTAEINF